MASYTFSGNDLTVTGTDATWAGVAQAIIDNPGTGTASYETGTDVNSEEYTEATIQMNGQLSIGDGAITTKILGIQVALTLWIDDIMIIEDDAIVQFGEIVGGITVNGCLVDITADGADTSGTQQTRRAIILRGDAQLLVYRTAWAQKNTGVGELSSISFQALADGGGAAVIDFQDSIFYAIGGYLANYGGGGITFGAVEYKFSRSVMHGGSLIGLGLPTIEWGGSSVISASQVAAVAPQDGYSLLKGVFTQGAGSEYQCNARDADVVSINSDYDTLRPNPFSDTRGYQSADKIRAAYSFNPILQDPTGTKIQDALYVMVPTGDSGVQTVGTTDAAGIPSLPNTGDGVNPTNRFGYDNDSEMYLIAIEWSGFANDDPAPNSKKIPIAPWSRMAYSYRHLLPVSATFDPQPQSTGIQDTLTIVDDLAVDVYTRATVQAYTTLETPNQLYDWAKDWKCTTANVAYPTRAELLITASGPVVVIDNSIELIVDAAATSAGDVNTTTDVLTIKATDFAPATSTTNAQIISGVSIASGSKITIASGTTVSASITLNTGASADVLNETQAKLLDMQGGALDLGDNTGAALAGSFPNGDINLSSILTNTTLDLRETTNLGAGLTVNYGGAQNVIVLILPNHTAPSLNYTGSGGSLTVVASLQITLSPVINDSVVQLYNESTSTELDLSTVSGGEYGYSITPAEFTSGDVIRYRIAYQSGTTAKSEIEDRFVITDQPVTEIISQVDDAVNNTAGIDGSTVTECSYNLATTNIDIDDPNNVTSLQRIGAWYHYYITTNDGIRNLFGCLQWDQINVINLEADTCDLHVNNVDAVNALTITGGKMTRSDGSAPVATGSGSILIYPDEVFDSNLEAIVDDGYTHLQVLRTMASVLAGKASMGPNGSVFRSIGDTKDRVESTTNDDGDRLNVVIDAD